MKWLGRNQQSAFELRFEEARNFYRSRQYTEALKYSIGFLPELSDPNEKAKLADFMSTCEEELGNEDQMLIYAGMARDTTNDPTYKLFYMAIYCCRTSDFGKAHSIFCDLLQKYKRGFQKGILEYWYGTTSVYINKNEEALKYLTIADKYISSEEAPHICASLLMNYSHVLLLDNQLVKGLQIIDRAQMLADYLSVVEKVSLYRTKGNLLYDLGQYQEAIEPAQKALHLTFEVKQCTDLDRTTYFLDVARCQVAICMYAEAKEALDQIEVPIDDEWNEFLYYKNVTKCLFYLKQYTKVIPELRIMLQLKETAILEEKIEYEHKKMLCVALAHTGAITEANTVLKEIREYKSASEADLKETQALIDSKIS